MKRHDKPLTLKEIGEVKDEDIDFSDIPELGDEFWKNAKVVRAGPDGTGHVAHQALRARFLSGFRERLPDAHQPRAGDVCSGAA